MLERIICYFKKLFGLQENIFEDKIDEVNLEKKDVSELKAQEVSSCPKVFEETQVFDVLYVRMRDIDISPDLSLSHQSRPFLVIRKDEENREVEGYYMTSNIQNTKFSQDHMKKYRMVLSNEKYSLPKNRSSLVKIDKRIDLPADHIQRKITSLDLEDQQKLHKLSFLYRGQSVVVKNLELGDILNRSLKDYYLIYQQDHSLSYGFKLNRVPKTGELKESDDNRLNVIYSNQYVYKANFSETESFSNQSKFFVLSDIINLSQVQNVLDNRDKVKYLAKERRRKGQ